MIKKGNTLFQGLRTKKISEDLFIKRLRSLVVGEGMLHEGNIYLMDHAIKNMPTDGIVLEIGSYGGLSTNLMLHLLKKHNRTVKLLNCDPWIYEGYQDANGQVSSTIDGRDDVSRNDFSDYMKRNFISGVSLLHKDNLPHSFQLTSDAFFELYGQTASMKELFDQHITPGVKISFAYIDGNHNYEYVKRDFENVDKYLNKSGYVLFDDSIDGSSFGSSAFMAEMKRNKNYKLVDKNPNYLFRKVM